MARAPHAHHEGSKEKFASYRLDQDLEAWLGHLKDADAADPEPVLFEL
ncbi:MAG: hypothetical protein V4510_05225 [bacterium]